MSKLQSKTNYMYIIVENSPDKFQVWKSTKSNNSISMMPSVMVLVHCTSPNEIYLPMKFQVSSFITFWVMLRTKFKNENEQRAITPKVRSFELWFLCTALLLNEIYLPMKLHVEALNNFQVMLRKKRDGRTDWQTDGRTSRLLYATFWGHKKM